MREDTMCDFALKKGTVLQGQNQKYTIERVLGIGGFGITYKVSSVIKVGNISTTMNFAVKEHFLKEFCERDPNNGDITCSKPVRFRVEESKKDFLSEAKRLNSLSGVNANIVPVNEVIEANGTAYYVMEYFDGGSLRDYVNAHGPLSEKEAISLIVPIAKAIGFLHQNKINHLDIKPDNVMFRINQTDNTREPVLIDFGLAKHFDSHGNPTSTIRVQGCSDGYAPIEQYAGLRSFSPQADIYALGALLYFMLVGKSPAISTEIYGNMIEASLPSSVSKSTKNAIIHAMRPSKTDRTVSADCFLQEIGEVPNDSFSQKDIRQIDDIKQHGKERQTMPVDSAKAISPSLIMQNGKQSRQTIFMENEKVASLSIGKRILFFTLGIFAGLISHVLLILLFYNLAMPLLFPIWLSLPLLLLWLQATSCNNIYNRQIYYIIIGSVFYYSFSHCFFLYPESLINWSIDAGFRLYYEFDGLKICTFVLLIASIVNIFTNQIRDYYWLIPLGFTFWLLWDLHFGGLPWFIIVPSWILGLLLIVTFFIQKKLNDESNSRVMINKTYKILIILNFSYLFIFNLVLCCFC